MKIAKSNLFSVSKCSSDWSSWDKGTYTRPKKCVLLYPKIKMHFQSTINDIHSYT